MIQTEAWTLHKGNGNGHGDGNGHGKLAQLLREQITLAEPTDQEVLVEPIYGCWEGNMAHALRRDPVDICLQRKEEKVVIGNAGVVRVLKPGASVSGFKEGDLCLVFCNGIWDEFGYPKKIFAYDAPGTVGLLAKRTKLHEKQLIHIPAETRFSLQQWAAFSLRYITAWANWKMAYGCWRLQFNDEEKPTPYVWGWGGGVTLAELGLAQFDGCRVAMLSSDDARLKMLEELGIEAIDRRQFGDLNFDQERYQSDPDFKKAYQQAEEAFVRAAREKTRGQGVSIFIDFVGLPVFRATLKTLARPGVITTAGWKEGMNLSMVRAIECMNWHVHVHTHYARYREGVEAVAFGEAKGWMPPVDDTVYGWEEIPLLAQDYDWQRISSYFPIFQVSTL